MPVGLDHLFEILYSHGDMGPIENVVTAVTKADLCKPYGEMVEQDMAMAYGDVFLPQEVTPMRWLTSPIELARDQHNLRVSSQAWRG